MVVHTIDDIIYVFHEEFTAAYHVESIVDKAVARSYDRDSDLRDPFASLNTNSKRSLFDADESIDLSDI